jgi:MFS transporter, ACS family, tartrate transporter
MSESQIFAKCAWRLIPFMSLLYLVSFIDRTNAGFAALTMNKDLGFSPTVFGLGAGIFFVGYALCQVPANLILERIGARRWVFCILAVWGVLSASNALVRSPAEFYAVRFFLGVAEAGFYPGMLLYLTYWFPRQYLARFSANFMIAVPLSVVIGGPLASVILGMNGVFGVSGWQWLFLMEGLPAFLLSFAVLKLLPDGPSRAAWLSDEEKKTVASRLATEELRDRCDVWAGLRDARVLALGVASFCYQASGYGLYLWFPQIVQAMGFSSFANGFIVASCFVAGIPAMILGGRSSSMRDERIWHVALPLLLAAFAFAAAGVMHSIPVVLATLAFAWLVFYSAYGPFFSLPSTFLRGTAAAGGIGLFNTFGSLGGFFGPSLFGVLKERSGDYATALAASAVLLVLTALIVLAVGRALVPHKTELQATPSGAA